MPKSTVRVLTVFQHGGLVDHRHIAPKSSANPRCHVQEAFDAQYSCTLTDWPGHGPRYISESHFPAGWKQQ